MRCTVCGRQFAPAGRGVGLEASGSYCDTFEPCDPDQKQAAKRRHLWDEHDSNRSYTDAEGWRQHQVGCVRCCDYELVEVADLRVGDRVLCLETDDDRAEHWVVESLTEDDGRFMVQWVGRVGAESYPSGVWIERVAGIRREN